MFVLLATPLTPAGKKMRVPERFVSRLGIALAIFVVVLVEQGRSQNPTTTPRRPSISPYLNLTNPNSGVLSPFHAFVVPGIEQQKQQAMQLMIQSRTMHLEKSQTTVTELRQTGLGGKFQNYSHFYPTPKSYPKR